MLDWLLHFAEHYAGLFIGMSIFSALSAIVTVGVGVQIVKRLPRDYFINSERRRQTPSRFPLALRILLSVVRNVLGAIFLIAGIMMLVLPGQGILTIVAGVLLMDFPGKFALESWLIGKKPIRRAVNWLRRRAGAPPMIIDRDSG